MAESIPVPFNSARFVVLRHEMPAGAERATHWDFMLETPEGLRTWALANEPDGGEPTAADALAPHRAEYLTFEGPVSGGRGTVTQWDAGSFRWQRDDEAEVVLQLAGNRLRGQATLVRQPGSEQRWQFAFAAEPA
ncbi:MAG TPA: DNA polymerase ligase N-terminal domain-containing protein [Pirellulales bacterium]|jgi:hypothetical protein|nr:DNA polymerase ligase N-terminal domain-containing protein [Pirellulales bacterium]